MDEPIRLRTNVFWGKRSGAVTKTGEHVIKGKRAASTKRENKGPSGRALRGQKQRIAKRYQNLKLRRQSAQGWAMAVQKGKKAMEPKVA